MTLRSTPSQKQEEQTPRHPLTDLVSPFTAGINRTPAEITPTDLPGIGFVVSESIACDDDGLPKRITRHLVGIACQHWAPSAETTGDCRFGCLKEGLSA